MATAVKSAPRPSPMIGRLAGREAAREACPTDSITSSYGVGPTDDRGRPLFGLKALRRTNTNRTLPDAEPSADTSTKQSTSSTSNYTSRISSTVTGASSRPRAADITDSSGLPLFGGLRALKVNSTTTSSSSTTTEQSARESPAQLRDRSVQDDKAPVLDRADSFRSTISVQLSPSVGDSRKFSFEKSAEQTGGGERSSPVSRRKLSDDSRSSSSSSVLRSLIEKHENISSSGDALLDSSRRGILKKARDEPGASSTTATSSSYSRSTVVSRRQVVGPDGSVSLTRDVIRGETVSKAGQEPVTNVTREHFAYETPRPRDEPSALTITQLDSGDEGRGSRKSSPSPDRVLIESAQSSKRSSRNFDEDTKYSSSFRRSSAQDDFIQTEKKHSTLTSQNGDELGDCGSRLYSSKVVGDSPNKWSSTVTSKKTDGDATTHTTTTTSKERRSSGGVTSESTSVSSKSITTSKSTSPSRKSPTRDASKKQSSEKWSSGSNSESKTTSRFSSSSRTSTSRNSSSNIERRRSSATADDVSEEGSSTVTSSLLRTSQRGSVRALQEKFQKAAADANNAETSRSNRSYPKAGLIFRSASFRSSSGDGSVPVTPSSPNTPSTPLSESGTNPTLKQSASMEVRVGSPVASPLPSTPGTASSETRSFLNDRTAVTDVHDVLARMRNADIVVESGDSAEDQAARSLLNKFLGASVILQGMEPLVSDRHSSSTVSSASARQTIVTGSTPAASTTASTTSAALVSQVERQRLNAGNKVTNGSASDPTADLNSIWDEAHLRSLLDACSDYEGRRKIRARLRTVMAEQKACEGVVAAAQRSATDESRSVDGDTSSASSVHGESLLLPYLVEHLRSSLHQQQQQELRQQQQANPRSRNHHLPASSSAGHAIEDSGTESGEDLRFLAAGLRDSIELHRQESSAQLSAASQPHGPGPGPGPGKGLQGLGLRHDQDGLLDDVQSALSRLEASLLLGVVGSEKVDSSRQESLLQLVSRLKSSLGAQQPAAQTQAPAVPPRRFGKRGRQNRHTVGVSQEELADARRFLEEAQAAQAAQAKSQPQGQGDHGPARPAPPADTEAEAEAGEALPAPLVVSLPLTRARSPYQLQKQSSAGDLPGSISSFSASTFCAFRPAHFMPKRFSFSAASTPPNASVPASASASGSSLAHSESVQDDVSFASRSARSKSSSQSSVSRRQATVALKKTPHSSYSSVGSQSNEDDDEEEDDDDDDDDIDEEDEDKGAFVVTTAGKPEGVGKVLDNNANLVAETDITSKDYDPSKKLFTAAQSVQIAVHKAAINKQLSVEEQRKPSKAETSEDESEVTESVDEETEEDFYDVEDDDDVNAFNTQPSKGVKASDTKEPPPGVLRNQTFTVQPAESIIGKIRNTSIEPRAPCDPKSAKQAPKDIAPPPKTVMVQNPAYIEEKTVVYHHDQDTKVIKQLPSAPPAPARHDLDRADTQSNASDTSDTLQGEETSSAQRLLKMATTNSNENSSKVAGSRFSNRSSKKQKMKRANTIDIPKPLNYYEVDEETDGEVTSGDEAFHSAQDSASSSDKRAAYLALRGPIRVTPDAQKGQAQTQSPQQQQRQPPSAPPPKTDNDRKFLAFLEQQGGKKGGTGGSLWSGADEHNGSASPMGGHGPGHQWNNRFSNIKTAFENNASHGSREQQLNRINSDRSGGGARQGGARSFWQTADDSAAMLKGRGRGGRANGAPHEPRLSKQASAFLKQLHEQPGHQANKLPWAAAEHPDDPGVVVGSLTVAATHRQQQHQQRPQPESQPRVADAPSGPVNKFIHAPMSAFKPIEKSKPTPSAPWATPPASTGSVKQLAAQKFEQPSSPAAPAQPEKTVVHAPKAMHPHPHQHQPQHQPQPQQQSRQLPLPEQAASPLSPTLPWKKDLGHSHHLTSTLAKFESLSSRETSPQLVPVMRSQSQDRIAGGLGLGLSLSRQYPQPPQPPPRAFILAPSTGTVQSRTQTFSSKQAAAPAPAPALPPALPPHNAYAHEFSTRPGFGHGLVHSKSNQYVPSADYHWHHQPSFDSDPEDLQLPPTDNKLVLSTLRGADVDVVGHVSPSLNAPPIPTFSAGVTVRQSVFGLPAVTPSVTPGVTPSVTPTVARSTPDSYSSTPPPYGAAPAPEAAQQPLRPPRLVIQDAAGTAPVPVPSPGGPVLGTPEPEEHTAAVARVMGGAQYQKAVTVSNKMRHRYDDDKGGVSGVSSAAFNLANVLHKFSSSEEDILSPQQSGQLPQPQQQPQQKQPAPRLRSEPNIMEATRPQAHQSNGGSPMTSVRPSPVATPYGTPYSNQSQSPVGDWSSHQHQQQPAKAKPVDVRQEARSQAAKKYAETRVADKAAGQQAGAPRPPAPAASRSRTSSTDSLITTSTEELQDSGESVVTTRLQIPVNKVADTIQRYQAHTQAHSQGQDVVVEQRSPSVSPNPGNVLRKSESWHQLAAQTQGLPVKGSVRSEGRPLSMHGPDLPPTAPSRSPGLAKAKSSHSLAFPKQFEAAIKPDALQVKQKTVEKYFKRADSTAGDPAGSKSSANVQAKQQYSKRSFHSSLAVSTRTQSKTCEPLTPVEVLLVDDNLDNVDEAFESLFAASVGSDGRTLSRQMSAEGKANYKQRRMSKPKSGGYSANMTRTSSVQGGSAIKSSK